MLGESSFDGISAAAIISGRDLPPPQKKDPGICISTDSHDLLPPRKKDPGFAHVIVPSMDLPPPQKKDPGIAVISSSNRVDRLIHGVSKTVTGQMRFEEHLGVEIPGGVSDTEPPVIIDERILLKGGLLVSGAREVNFAGGLVCYDPNERSQINIQGTADGDYDHQPEVMIHGGRSCVPINVESGRLYLDQGFQADIGMTVGENGRVYLDNAAVAGGLRLTGDSSLISLDGKTRVTGDLVFAGKHCDLYIYGDDVKVTRKARTIIQPGTAVWYEGEKYTDGEKLKEAMGDVFDSDFVVGSVPYQVAHAIESIPSRVVETAPPQIKALGDQIGASIIDQANAAYSPRHPLVHDDGMVDTVQAAVPSLINSSVSEVLNAGEDLLRVGDRHIGHPINQRIENTGRAITSVERYITEQCNQAAETVNNLARDIARLNNIISREVAIARSRISEGVDGRLLWPVRREIRHLRWAVEDNVEAARRNIHRIIEHIERRRNYTPLSYEGSAAESEVVLPDLSASPQQPVDSESDAHQRSVSEMQLKAEPTGLAEDEGSSVMSTIPPPLSETPPAQESNVQVAVSERSEPKSGPRRNFPAAPAPNTVGETASDAAVPVATTVRADDVDRIPVPLGEPSVLPVEPEKAAEVVEAPAKATVVAEVPVVDNLTEQKRTVAPAGTFSGEAIEAAAALSAIAEPITVNSFREIVQAVESAATQGNHWARLTVASDTLSQMLLAAWPAISQKIPADLAKQVIFKGFDPENPPLIIIAPTGQIEISISVLAAKEIKIPLVGVKEAQANFKIKGHGKSNGEQDDIEIEDYSVEMNPILRGVIDLYIKVKQKEIASRGLVGKSAEELLSGLLAGKTVGGLIRDALKNQVVKDLIDIDFVTIRVSGNAFDLAIKSTNYK